MKIFVTDDNLWRMERASKALRIAGKILGISMEQFDLLINEIHDYKGTLEIHWKVTHTPRQAQAFSDAWAECRENNVAHYLDGVKL